MRAYKSRAKSRFGRAMEEVAAVLWLAALSLIVLSGARGATGVLKHQRDLNYPRTAVVVVKPGDCVWNIAKRYGRPGEDPRRMVHVLTVANRIRPGQTLHPGDRLVIPYADTLAAPEKDPVVALR